jgi:hypothetical protein
MSENIAKYNVILELLTNTKGVDEVEKKVGGLQKTFNSAKTAFAGIAAGFAIQSIGQQIFETTAKFQGYESVLKNTLGSQQEAEKALNLIKDTAKGTVFSVDELTASYLKFANRGIKLTGAEITKLADIAASQGKSFDQLTEAVLDAQTGEFERLKEFGIRASTSGDQVTFAFKGVNTTIKNTPEAINALIASYGDLQGVQGSNITQMETLNGRMSNIGDTVDELFVKIGTALLPVFNFLLDVVVSVVAGLSTLANILISIPKFIQENAAAFYALGIAVVSFNIPLILSTTLMIKNTIASKAKAAADFFLASKTGLLTRAQWLLNAAFAANPIGLIVAAVALLVAGFVLLYNKSETVRNIFAGIANVAKSLVNIFKDVSDSITKTFSGGFLDGLKNIGTSIINGIKKSFSEAFSDLKNIVKGEDVAASALRLAKKVLNLMTFGLAGALTDAGKFVVDSFTKGFDENNEFEAKVKVKLNRGSFGGNYQKGIDDAKKAREKITADEKKLDEERQKRAEARQKKQDELDKLNEAARKKKYDSEIEAVEKTYALQEQEALKTIKDADELALKLKQIETQKQIDLTKIKIKYSKNGTSDAIKLENELIELESKYNEFFQRAKADPLDFLGVKDLGNVKKHAEILQNELNKLKISYNLVSDPKVKDGIKAQIEQIQSKIAKFQSPKLNKLTFQSGGFDAIDLDQLLPKDRVPALQDRLGLVTDAVENMKAKLNAGLGDPLDLKAFDSLIKEGENIIALLQRLGVEIPKMSEKIIKGTGDVLGISPETFKLIGESVDVARDAFQTITDIYVAELDNRIALQEDRVKQAEKIAEKGNVKQLELEEERLAKLEEQRKEASDRAAILQKAAAQAEIIVNTALTISNLQVAAAKTAGSSGPAAPVTVPIVLAIVGGLIASAANLFKPPSFIEGTEMVQSDSRFGQYKKSNGQDGYTARFDGKERIVDPITNSKLNGFPNAMLPEAVKYYQMRSKSLPVIAMSASKDNSMMESKLDALKESFEALRINVSLDQKGFIAEIDRLQQKRLDRQRYKA